MISFPFISLILRLLGVGVAGKFDRHCSLLSGHLQDRPYLGGGEEFLPMRLPAGPKDQDNPARLAIRYPRKLRNSNQLICNNLEAIKS